MNDDLYRDKSLQPVEDTLQAVIEGLTGILASDKKDLFLSIGYLFQRARGRSFLLSLHLEWQKYRKKGRIKKDYAQTEQCQACLQELLDCLDKESPDKIRFEFIKKVFLAAATESKSDRDSILPQQYMILARQLTSGEILVLTAAYRLSLNKERMGQNIDAGQWLQMNADESGLKHQNLVQNYENKLIQKGLITERHHADRSGIHLGDHNRLTSLSVELCNFILE